MTIFLFDTVFTCWDDDQHIIDQYTNSSKPTWNQCIKFLDENHIDYETVVVSACPKRLKNYNLENLDISRGRPQQIGLKIKKDSDAITFRMNFPRMGIHK